MASCRFCTLRIAVCDAPRRSPCRSYSDVRYAIYLDHRVYRLTEHLSIHGVCNGFSNLTVGSGWVHCFVLPPHSFLELFLETVILVAIRMHNCPYPTLGLFHLQSIPLITRSWITLYSFEPLYKAAIKTHDHRV